LFYLPPPFLFSFVFLPLSKGALGLCPKALLLFSPLSYCFPPPPPFPFPFPRRGNKGRREGIFLPLAFAFLLLRRRKGGEKQKKGMKGGEIQKQRGARGNKRGRGGGREGILHKSKREIKHKKERKLKKADRSG